MAILKKHVFKKIFTKYCSVINEEQWLEIKKKCSSMIWQQQQQKVYVINHIISAVPASVFNKEKVQVCKTMFSNIKLGKIFVHDCVKKLF